MPQTLELSAKARALRFTLRTTLRVVFVKAPPNVRMVEEAGNTGPKSMSARFGSNDDGQAQDAQQGVVPVGCRSGSPSLPHFMQSHPFSFGVRNARGLVSKFHALLETQNEDSRNATATWTEKAHRLNTTAKHIAGVCNLMKTQHPVPQTRHFLFLQHNQESHHEPALPERVDINFGISTGLLLCSKFFRTISDQSFRAANSGVTLPIMRAARLTTQSCKVTPRPGQPVHLRRLLNVPESHSSLGQYHCARIALLTNPSSPCFGVSVSIIHHNTLLILNKLRGNFHAFVSRLE
ncbi:hypothetical protein KC359_g129 [Hortaea werneckii]|nr:hypothetical protein KC359_g129 [Hortaea werneckii]